MRLRVLPSLVASVLVWVACVGDDPGSEGGIAPGDRGGPCKNGVCLSGLTCVDNVCVLVDGGSVSGDGGGPDGGGSDATSEAANGDSGAETGAETGAGCAPFVATGGKIACPGVTNGACTNEVCCINNGQWSCGLLAACATTPVECDDKNDCKSTDVCCLKGIVNEPAGMCPAQVHAFPGTRCVPSCTPNAETKLCNSDA